MKFLIIRSGPCSYELDTTVVEGRAQAQEELVSQVSRYGGDIELGDISFEVFRVEDGDLHQDFVDFIDEEVYELR